MSGEKEDGKAIDRGHRRALDKFTVVRVVLAFLLLFLGQGQIAYAATTTVSTADDELNSDGDCSLREAIQAANTDTAVDACPAGSGADTIVLPAGTYTLAIAGAGEDVNATGDFDITADLTIQGAGATTTVIDGADLDRVFEVLSGIVGMSGLTIRNGSIGGISSSGMVTLMNSTISDNAGAGVANGGDMTLASVTVQGNTADCCAAGIRNSGTLTIADSTISGNAATGKGAGILNDPTGTITIESSTISDNIAEESAGIDNQGTLTLIDSLVSGNAATGGGGVGGLGGGIGNDGSLTVEGSTFSDNFAENGGGIFNRSLMSITRTTFTGNTVTCCGAAVSNESGVATIEKSTFSINAGAHAVANGGDLTLIAVTVEGNTGGGIGNGDTMTIKRSTIRDNTATFDGGGIHNSGALTIETSSVSGNHAGDRGGGIFNQVGATVALRESKVTKNIAVTDGGGIFNDGGTVTLERSKVTKNIPNDCVSC
jgi:CSLREA domain-containing protein